MTSSIRFRRFALAGGLIALAWAASPWGCPSSSAADPSAPAVTLTTADGQDAAAPVTFGMVFKAGRIAKGKAVEVRSGDKPVKAQIDVTRRYDDGSVRFAVVSLAPGPAGRAGLPLDFAAVDEAGTGPGGSDEAAKKLLASGFDAVVALTFPDGTSASASARTMLEAAGAQAERWLSGPVATEWLLTGAPVDAGGKADPDLCVQFQVRAYEGLGAVRVSVVVENCWDTWAGNIGYDVEVKLGRDGARVYGKKDVHHRPLSRWRKVFWWPAPPPQAGVAHDATGLSDSGALPLYDRSVVVPEKTLADLAAQWARSSETDIMGSGSLTRYMPTTGGRPEIGPYPGWTVCHLLSRDPRIKAIVLGNGDLAGSWPIHVRSAKTRRLLTLDERPKFWINGYRDGDTERPIWKPDRKAPPPRKTADGKENPYYLSPDVAHMGSFAYVPYLLTGDFYYLEEAYFWGNYALLAQWPVPRKDARGLLSDQIRGNAWGLRNVADAGFIAPDGAPEARYFEEKVRNNLAEWTAAMIGPPEHNTLGFWGLRTVADARIGNAANPQWMVTAPWEHDFLIWSLHHASELGYRDAAPPRDFELRWRIGVFTHLDLFDPLQGAPYRMVVGEMGPDRKVLFYEDWKKLSEENAKLTPYQDPKRPGLSYDYSAYLALTCGADAGVPGAAEAVKVLLEKTGGFRGMLADPAWRIVPRNTPAATK
jgi:hypothetical protein